MKYGLYVNMGVDKADALTQEVLECLDGEEVLLENEVAAALGKKGRSLEEMDVDALITIGGDGTMLRAMQKTDAMIIGVNAGMVGFLTEIDRDEIAVGIDRLKNGDFFVEKRIKLRTVHDGKELAEAINEAVIHTDSVAKIRHFKVYVDGRVASDLRADGVIVATPTGSTCYAMSVGSPIIDPGVNAFVFVPMAPFKFTARPMVVPTSSTITVELMLEKGCLLVIDGQKEYHIPGRSRLDFSLSKNYGRFIRFEDNFYERMHDKLVTSL